MKSPTDPEWFILSSANGLCRRAYSKNLEDAKVELHQQIKLFQCSGSLLDGNTYGVLYESTYQNAVNQLP